jgi:hypothetical protein
VWRVLLLSNALLLLISPQLVPACLVGGQGHPAREGNHL